MKLKRRWWLLIHCVAAFAALLVCGPDAVARWAEDSDPRRRFGGWFFVLHSQGYVVAIQPPGRTTQVFNLGPLAIASQAILVAYATYFVIRSDLAERRWWKRRRERRIERGKQVCRTCCYDLRATPSRCPECGTVPLGLEATAPSSDDLAPQ